MLYQIEQEGSSQKMNIGHYEGDEGFSDLNLSLSSRILTLARDENEATKHNPTKTKDAQTQKTYVALSTEMKFKHLQLWQCAGFDSDQTGRDH